MKTFLVTGVGGFIGHHVFESLVSEGHRVIGVGHGAFVGRKTPASAPSLLINGTVDFANLQQVTIDFGPVDAVFHLAGGAHVGRSFSNPVEDFERTVGSTIQLLDWLRLSNPQAPIVVASSAAVYGAGHSGPIQEDARLDPFSPYGFHKAMQEQLCRSYGKNFGLPFSIVRLFSVYGEKLTKQLVFDLCNKLSDGTKSIQLFGTGEELRDWLHVEDVVQLLKLALASASREGFVVNGGTGVGVSVAQIAKTLCAVRGLVTKVTFNGENRRGDPESLVADIGRSTDIGFAPRIELESGLARVAQWHQHWTA